MRGRPQRYSFILITLYRQYIPTWSVYQHDLLLLTLITWLRSHIVSFLHSKVTASFLFPYYILWKEVAKHRSDSRNGELSSSLRADYLHELFRILLHGNYVWSFPLFIYSIICLCQYGLMYNYFKLRLIIPNGLIYFLAQIILGSFCIFSAPALYLAISLWLPDSFYWRMALESKAWNKWACCYQALSLGRGRK